jgi:4-hydroxybenzoate polyprenyltransferase
VFACATAPVKSYSSLLKCCLWVWVHQLLCNVSNQARSREEDKLNHPWRPLPSGRISESEAVALRWAVVAGCVTLSSMYDQDLVLTTLGLVAVTFTYDELGGAGNVIGKALCTAGGYISFELGATTIIGMSCRYYVLKQPAFLSFPFASQVLTDNPQVFWTSYPLLPSSSVEFSSSPQSKHKTFLTSKETKRWVA